MGYDRKRACTYFGRLDALGADRLDTCPQCYLDPGHDPECAEWPNVQVLDENRQPTGGWVYHVPECRMGETEKTGES